MLLISSLVSLLALLLLSVSVTTIGPGDDASCHVDAILGGGSVQNDLPDLLEKDGVEVAYFSITHYIPIRITRTT